MPDPPLRVHLSPPDVGPEERALLLEAFDSNWIAPLGPHVDAFEDELAARVGASHAVALSSGTAALHLALLLHGVGPGDRVLVPTMTFVATVNAVRYVGAEPVFVDADARSWNMAPDVVAEELATASRAGQPYAAVVSVDLYGRCCDYDALEAACRDHEVPLIEDAAEALGASYRGRAAGTFGDAGVFSFNGNKIITTSGGGMLVTDDPEAARRARHLATQAREPAPHYEHAELGFNYRLSNLLAAVGRAQLRRLDDMLARRRAIEHRYRERLADLPGVAMPAGADEDHRPSAWLSRVTIDPQQSGTTREEVRLDLRRRGIEARPSWKPMHLQPVFADARCIGGTVASDLFDRGLCLPSGSQLPEADQDLVCDRIRSLVRG